MMRRHANLISTISALVGLGVSSFLLAQYTLPPALGVCGVGGGCHVVRACRIGSVPLGPMPVLGILGFLPVLLMTLSSRAWVQRLLVPTALLGGVIGVLLVVIQKTVCGAFCIYCLTVDTAAVVLALSAWVGRGAPVQISWRYRGAFLGLMVVVFGGIMFWRTAWVTRPVLAIHEATLPPTVAAEQRPDKVTVVLFMSITCPHCRAQHAALNEVLAQYGDRVRLVPKLPFRHPSDEQGARAIVCAGGQGKREAMVHDLYNAPFWPNVDRANCESVAAKMGLDLAAYRKCLDAPETEAQVAKDGAAIAEAMLSWVPVTFVGHDRFDGNATAEAIKASIEKALKISGAPPATAGASAR